MNPSAVGRGASSKKRRTTKGEPCFLHDPYPHKAARRPPAGSGAPCSGRPTARAEGMDTKVPELLMDALGEPKWGTACVWDATLPARPHALVRPLHTHPHTRLHSALDSPPCYPLQTERIHRVEEEQILLRRWSLMSGSLAGVSQDSGT